MRAELSESGSPGDFLLDSLWKRVDGIRMNGQLILGSLMILAGAALLAYGGFTTTKRENVIEAGPLKVQADVKERHEVPPVLSWSLLIGGLAVVALAAKRK